MRHPARAYSDEGLEDCTAVKVQNLRHGPKFQCRRLVGNASCQRKYHHLGITLMSS